MNLYILCSNNENCSSDLINTILAQVFFQQLQHLADSLFIHLILLRRHLDQVKPGIEPDMQNLFG